MTFNVHQQRFLDGVAMAARGVLSSVPSRQARNMPFQGVEFRESPDGSGGSKLHFTGYASVTNTPYEMEDFLGSYNETVSRGAFAKTLSEKPDVAFLLNHGGVTMARTKSGTLRLAEDNTGLHAEADLDPSRSDVQLVKAGVDSGDLDEMSFAFRVMRQDWNEDYTDRHINEVNLNKGDVSVVNYGANPHTGGLVAMRSADMLRSGLPDLMRLVVDRELRAGNGLSADTTALLKQVLSMTADADKNVDEIQVMLSKLLGVKNPDIEQDAEMQKKEPEQESITVSLHKVTAAEADMVCLKCKTPLADERAYALLPFSDSADQIVCVGCAADDEAREKVSDAAWDFNASDYSIEQLRKACLVVIDGGKTKDDCHLPVRTPDGTLVRAACHAAASVLGGGRGGLDVPATEKESAAKKLVSIYRSDLKEDPPASLLKLAGESVDEKESAPAAGEQAKAAPAFIRGRRAREIAFEIKDDEEKK